MLFYFAKSYWYTWYYRGGGDEIGRRCVNSPLACVIITLPAWRICLNDIKMRTSLSCEEVSCVFHVV